MMMMKHDRLRLNAVDDQIARAMIVRSPPTGKTLQYKWHAKERDNCKKEAPPLQAHGLLEGPLVREGQTRTPTCGTTCDNDKETGDRNSYSPFSCACDEFIHPDKERCRDLKGPRSQRPGEGVSLEDHPNKGGHHTSSREKIGHPEE
mmetsp:Transcript_16940/g.34368  ORF Transcript_16940/g.34368 Transcript_16940/m.34368 type:complete len:147 (+) Transcript_16940:103-543(+)